LIIGKNSLHQRSSFSICPFIRLFGFHSFAKYSHSFLYQTIKMEEVGSAMSDFPQLKGVLNDFVASVLLHKPNDLYHFANNYFSSFHSSYNQKLTPIVICGPSGVGKGTLIEKLMKEFPDKFGFSVSHTTRKPRPGEQDSVHYHFTNVEDMNKAIQEGKFVEHANVHGNLYGTSKAAVEAVMKSGKICILDIDVQGAEQVKKSSLLPRYVFISPPSVEELEKRLRGRGTESEESIQKRMNNAKGEMEYLKRSGFWDFVLINDDLDSTYVKLKNYIFS